MAKILLVEDDNNLREIYEARLQAEGYTIVSAQDGEDALVKAKQEKPDLVISDVMMPRISGFEMLDILRNTEGLKETKVIMLTALGQSEDKTRADALGADRYLVKSQVTLEDIVKAADELLNGGEAPAAPEPANATAAPAPMPVQAPPTEATATPSPAQPVSNVTTPVAPTIPVAAAPADATTAPTATPAASSTPATPVAAPTATPPPSMPVVQPPQPETTPAAPPASTPGAVHVEATPHIAPTNTMPTAPVPTPPATPAPVTTPASAVPLTPASTPSPTAAAIPSAAPPVAAQSQTAAADDKLVVDAVKQLTETLDTEQQAKNKAPAEKPVITPPSNTPTPAMDSVDQPAKATEATPAPVASPVTPAPAVQTEAETTPPAPESAPSSTTPQKSEALPPILTGEPEEEAAPPAIQAVATPVTEPAPVPVPVASPQPVEQPVTAEEAPALQTEKTAEPTNPMPAVVAEPKIDAASAADEQALMQQQIDSFINQQGTPPEVTADPQSVPDAVAAPAETNSTESPIMEPTPVTPAPAVQTEAETTPPAPETIQPTITPPAPAPESSEVEVDDISIAHKKVIQPPVEPLSTKPDLSELLAKEGITPDDSHDAPDHPHGGFATPHQPGHVISPNGTTTAPTSSDDPNSIAL